MNIRTIGRIISPQTDAIQSDSDVRVVEVKMRQNEHARLRTTITPLPVLDLYRRLGPFCWLLRGQSGIALTGCDSHSILLEEYFPAAAQQTHCARL
jgi:hypothetical protein